MINPKPRPPGEEHSLSERPVPEMSADPIAFAAMAEAFRAQAETLHHINATQQEIAKKLQTGDRAQGVLASTRALNETFKSLREIQKGLLEAVLDVKMRRGWPLAVGLLIVVAFAACLFVVQQLSGRSSSDVSQAEFDRVRSAQRDADEDLRDLRRVDEARVLELARLTEQLTSARKEVGSLQALGETRKNELARMRAANAILEEQAAGAGRELENFLLLKDQADRAGAFEIENADLKRRLRAAEDRLEHVGSERERLAGLVLEGELDSRSPADRILKAAIAKGLLEGPKPAPRPGVVELHGIAAANFARRINRLLQQADGPEGFEVVTVKTVVDGTRLGEVAVTRYKGLKLLNTLQSKSLEIFVDLEKDSLELRFADGFYTSTIATGDKIPFSGGKHAVFLRNVGLKEWLGRFSLYVEVGPDGRLTWKTPAS